MESTTHRWSAATAAKPEDPLGAVIAFCRVWAIAGEDGRLSDRRARFGCCQTGADMKASFEAGIKEHLEILGRFVAKTSSEESDGKAMAILSTMVGALTLSRVVDEPDLAQAFLDSATDQVREAVAAERCGQRWRRTQIDRRIDATDFVTGMGAVTPLAADVEASWSRLLASRSGIRRLPDDVVGDLPTKIGGVVPALEEDHKS